MINLLPPLLKPVAVFAFLGLTIAGFFWSHKRSGLDTHRSLALGAFKTAAVLSAALVVDALLLR